MTIINTVHCHCLDVTACKQRGKTLDFSICFYFILQSQHILKWLIYKAIVLYLKIYNIKFQMIYMVPSMIFHLNNYYFPINYCQTNYFSKKKKIYKIKAGATVCGACILFFTKALTLVAHTCTWCNKSTRYC